MAQDADNKFYERADAHIHLSNEQLTDASSGRVSASMMYGAARFSAWFNASGFHSAEEMAAAKNETLEYFSTEYRKALEENLNDYIANFDKYMARQVTTNIDTPT